ncbi:MAG: carboxypeptidase-like regulatory domain-containing protein [candidate division KSB1 bacterium]|nr:carboxypeptidase-like regulatory domain-containing protein [candidate division KSB1 bacterium]
MNKLRVWIRNGAVGLLVLSVTLASAGTTGKIAGTVVDADTGEPLPGVNVILEGTTMGAATDMAGRYVVLFVPPGIYTLRASMIGYSAMRVENVRVSIDLTTEINFKLKSAVLELGEAVTIVAERPMVVKDLTASTAVMGGEEIKALPVTEVHEALALTAGLVRDAGGGLHIRGGRSGEISYWIDGIPVTDVYDGGTVVDVNKNMVQELQVVSGAFNAEYGQAMSGIVNISTKEGGNTFGGSFTTYAGDHLSTHDKIFPYIKNINPLAIRNVEGSLEGPILRDKLSYFVNARYIHFDGWLYGQRRYQPHAVTVGVVLPEQVVEENFPEFLSESRVVAPGQRGFQYVLGTNAIIDSVLTQNELRARNISADSFAVYYQRLRSAHQNGRGDGAFVPMNWNRKLYLQGKLMYRPVPWLQLAYNVILDDVDYQDYQRDYKYNPDGQLQRFRTGLTHIFKATHLVSSKTFYTFGFSQFSKVYKSWTYEDPYDPHYVHPDVGLQGAYSFKTGGTDNWRFERRTDTYLAKFDLTSQVTVTHQLKGGLEFRKHKVYQRDVALQPVLAQSAIDLLFQSPFIATRVLPDSTIYASQYTHRPTEFSAYLQDKMEFKNFIVNFGLRMDYFEPDGVVLADETDPTIYNPIKPQNRYHDWGSDGQPGTHDLDGSEGNGIWDPGEPAVTLAERQQYWYKRASAKVQVSPRLGVSFPITDRGVIHFSYGHFFQIPRFERLYQNPDFELGTGTGNLGVIGNADLKPEQTVSGEIGLQQQLTEDLTLHLTGYFRDVRNLAGTQAEEIVLFGGFGRYSKLVNSDFGFIRGIIVSLNKRFAGGLAASLDYTMQIAKGTASDPEQARNALSGGALPEVQLTPLDWDQRHTLNATLSYAGRGYGASLVGQLGSGLPYTPRSTADISTLLTNSQRKPGNLNVDLRAYKEFRLKPGMLTLFVRVFNLLDRLNEVNVYNDTGRAGFTYDEAVARSSNPLQLVNTLEDWFTNPTHYSEPRRVEVGVTLDFGQAR